MNLDEALAIWIYAKDNIESWTEPMKSAKAEAWQTICKYAQSSIQRRADGQQAKKEE